MPSCVSRSILRALSQIAFLRQTDDGPARYILDNGLLTLQSSGSTSVRTQQVIDFYSKLPKGPIPASEQAGGLRGKYFEGKNASA